MQDKRQTRISRIDTKSEKQIIHRTRHTARRAGRREERKGKRQELKLMNLRLEA